MQSKIIVQHQTECNGNHKSARGKNPSLSNFRNIYQQRLDIGTSSFTVALSGNKVRLCECLFHKIFLVFHRSMDFFSMIMQMLPLNCPSVMPPSLMLNVGGLVACQRLLLIKQSPLCTREFMAIWRRFVGTTFLYDNGFPLVLGSMLVSDANNSTKPRTDAALMSIVETSSLLLTATATCSH